MSEIEKTNTHMDYHFSKYKLGHQIDLISWKEDWKIEFGIQTSEWTITKGVEAWLIVTGKKNYECVYLIDMNLKKNIANWNDWVLIFHLANTWMF